jgi:hypothetical protein
VFESFVIGALDAADSEAFVAHVSTCDACAAKLQNESRHELAIAEVHAASPKRVLPGIVPAKRRTAAWIGAGALALAAALLLFVLGRPRVPVEGRTETMTVTAPPVTTPIPLVVCRDGRGQEKCVEEAHRHGLFVSYPPWAKAPPLGGGRSGQGPNGPPFVQQM